MAIRHDVTEPRSSLWDNDHVGDLDDLDDVNAPSPSDNDALTWDSGTSKWIPEAVTGSGSGELVVTDGITDPPEAVWTEAGDDFIYEDI